MSSEKKVVKMARIQLGEKSIFNLLMEGKAYAVSAKELRDLVKDVLEVVISGNMLKVLSALENEIEFLDGVFNPKYFDPNFITPTGEIICRNTKVNHQNIEEHLEHNQFHFRRVLIGKCVLIVGTKDGSAIIAFDEKMTRKQEDTLNKLKDLFPNGFNLDAIA